MYMLQFLGRIPPVLPLRTLSWPTRSYQMPSQLPWWNKLPHRTFIQCANQTQARQGSCSWRWNRKRIMNHCSAVQVSVCPSTAASLFCWFAHMDYYWVSCTDYNIETTGMYIIMTIPLKWKGLLGNFRSWYYIHPSIIHYPSFLLLLTTA